METLKKSDNRRLYPSDFSLEKFTQVYVTGALDIVKEYPLDSELCLASEFYKRLNKSVSEKIGVSKEAVSYIHHPFHWIFFNGNNDSPFRYIQTMSSSSRIGLKRKQTPEDVAELSNLVLKDHGVLLRERIKSLEQRKQEREEYTRQRIQNLLNPKS